MTLLHQAAQKAVEAHYKELGDAWIAFDGSPGTAKRVNFALGMLGFAIDALVAQMSALQQQTEPVAWLVTGGRAYNDRAYIAKDRAELEAVDRRDGSKAVPLYTAPALQHQEEPREPVADFDTWQQNPYTKVLMDSIKNDYMPRADAEALIRAAASPSTTRQQEAVTIATLRQHWLRAMECDHASGRDKPHCACSRVDLGWHASVGAAVEAWLTHVSEAHTQQQEAGSVPSAKLVNGQWEGAPLSQFPELQEQVRKGLADGTLQVEGGPGVPALLAVRCTDCCDLGCAKCRPAGVAVPAPAAPFTCWGLSSFCAEVGHKCRAAGACIYTPPKAAGEGGNDGR